MINLDGTFFVQMAIFLAFTLFINHFLLRPVAQHIARRRESIEGLRETGDEQGAALEALQKEYSLKLNAAREELLAQRTAARKEAMDIQNSILEEAKKESHQELFKAESELDKAILKEVAEGNF